MRWNSLTASFFSLSPQLDGAAQLLWKHPYSHAQGCMYLLENFKSSQVNKED